MAEGAGEEARLALSHASTTAWATRSAIQSRHSAGVITVAAGMIVRALLEDEGGVRVGGGQDHPVGGAAGARAATRSRTWLVFEKREDEEIKLVVVNPLNCVYLPGL